MSEQTIAAVEVGFGDTKWMARVGGLVSQGKFPSVAYSVVGDDEGPLLTQRNLMCVRVETGRFAVGQDVLELPDAKRLARASSRFSLARQFEALVLAAIAQMDVRVIDTLFLVVPNDEESGSVAEYLRKRLTGEIAVPQPNVRFAPVTKPVLVRSVTPVSDAVAGFLGAAVHPQALRSPFVVDMGYHHLRCTTSPSQSALADQGLARFFDHLAWEIRQLYEDRFPGAASMPPLTETVLQKVIGDAGCIDTPMGRLDVGECVASAAAPFKDVIATAIDLEMLKVGEARAVALIGGGAEVLAPLVRSLLPRLPRVPFAAPEFVAVDGALALATGLASTYPNSV